MEKHSFFDYFRYPGIGHILLILWGLCFFGMGSPTLMIAQFVFLALLTLVNLLHLRRKDTSLLVANGLVIGLYLLVIVLSVISGWAMPEKEVAQQAMSNASKGAEAKVVTEYDDREDPEGNGIYGVVYEFRDKEALKQIREDPNWKKLPMSENCRILAYGSEDGSIKPRIVTKDGEPFIPEIENGYWCFMDRDPSVEAGKEYDDSQVLERDSLHFSIALYDLSGSRMYSVDMDQ